MCQILKCGKIIMIFNLFTNMLWPSQKLHFCIINCFWEWMFIWKIHTYVDGWKNIHLGLMFILTNLFVSTQATNPQKSTKEFRNTLYKVDNPSELVSMVLYFTYLIHLFVIAMYGYLIKNNMFKWIIYSIPLYIY